MRLTPRKRLFIDPKLQGPLLTRVVAYWCFYFLVITEVLMCWDIATGPVGPFFSHFRFDVLWEQHSTVVIASLIVLPVLLWDVLHISNRIVGPVYRMRRSLRAMADGEFVAPIKVRQGDFGAEMADEVNAVAAYLERLKQHAGLASTPAEGQSACEVAHL